MRIITKMGKKIEILTEKKRWGVRVLLDWCVSEYKNPDSKPLMWKQRIDILSKIQRKTHYTRFDKVVLNALREEYINERKGVVR